MSQTGDLAHSPGMCTDWESKQRPFGLKAHALSTEPHPSGFIKGLNRAISHLETRRASEGLYKMEEGWGKGANKRKEMIIFRPGHPLGGREWQGFFRQIALASWAGEGGWKGKERAHMTDYPTGA